MAKSIVKEIIIILLLTLAIILVLGVLLYEYVPTNKIVPEKVSYTTPEEVKTELESDINESDDELYVDYHIDSTDLNNYKRIQEYVPGRKNPFADPGSESASDTENETTQGGTASTETEENSGYLPDKGTK